VAVNRSWDEYCKQLQLSHSQQVAALNAELSDARQRLDDRQRSDVERQRDFDELLLSAKKQRQDEEVSVLISYLLSCHIDPYSPLLVNLLLSIFDS